MKKKGTFFIVFGLLLIAASVALTLYDIWDSNRAGKESAQIMQELEMPQTFREVTSEVHKVLESVTVEYPPMATQEKNGFEYIGTLEFPSLSLKLPVMAQWNTYRLRISPCVYSGSYYSSDLVICGHNYPTHFSKLKTIPLGEEFFLNTVDGYCYRYQVDSIETLKPTDVSQMITSTDWDLTLFTCNTGGQTRCAVRCSLVSQ